MPIFLESPTPGVTVALQPSSVVGKISLLKVEPELSWSSHRILISQIGLHQSVNHSLTSMLAGDSYLYVFGDKPMDVRIHGKAFRKTCGDPDTEHVGLNQMLKWYEANKASARSSPIKVTLGSSSTSFSGYLIDTTMQLADPSTMILDYTLDIICPPSR